LAISTVNLTILKIVQTAYAFVSMILKYYSIWIYHVSANLVLLSEPKDIVTIFMLVFECVSTMVHFAIWKKSGVHPYKLVYRIWSPSFYILVVYAMVRYSTFFLQYIHARAVYAVALSLVGLDGQQIVKDKVGGLDQVENYTYEYYVKSYFRLLVLVTIAVYTRNTLESVIDENKADAEAKLNNLMKSSNTKSVNDVLSTAGKKSYRQTIYASHLSDNLGLSGKMR
jgi:hypothetical protein